MNPSDLHQLTRRRPFEPFRLIVSDGTDYDIIHPELCVVHRTTVIVSFAGPLGMAAPLESFHFLDPRHIVKAVPLGPATLPTEGRPPRSSDPPSDD